MSIYHFSVQDNLGKEHTLEEYRGKVLLIVNTATGCGLTPQYAALQTLYETYCDRGLVILDFPCNQFLEQAPGTDEEIHTFCTLNYATTFPRFAKIDVNGPHAHPLFAWLKEQAPEDYGDNATAAFAEQVRPFTPDSVSGDIRWNFGKFLLDRDGAVSRRYSPAWPPEKLEQDILALLQAPAS